MAWKQVFNLTFLKSDTNTLHSAHPPQKPEMCLGF